MEGLRALFVKVEDGSGSCSCSGSGSGSGSGYGDGYGDGYGSCIKDFAGETVYWIDNVQTILDHVRGNVAKGRILNGDLTTKKCWIVKQDGKFAHGASLREAQQALVDKLFDDMPEDERIEAFVAEHEINTAYPNRVFYSWHHRLTGSCDLGRKTWVEERGLSLDDSITTREFLELTKDAYGGSVIRKVLERYG